MLEASDKPGILMTRLTTDGGKRVTTSRCRGAGGKGAGSPFLKMDGQAVFRQAVILRAPGKPCSGSRGRGL